jgi:hypothetical protein
MRQRHLTNAIYCDFGDAAGVRTAEGQWQILTPRPCEIAIRHATYSLDIPLAKVLVSHLLSFVQKAKAEAAKGAEIGR